MSFPFLSNILWGFTLITTYKSPVVAPLHPASPSPEILKFVPSAAPSGIFISIFLVLWTVPLPPHSVQWFFIIFPCPLQRPHVDVVWNIPKGVLCVLVAVPLPPQSGHFTASSGFSAPVPWHFGHSSSLGILIVFAAPKAASSSSISISYLKSEPLWRRLLLPPPPNTFSKMLSKSNPPASDMTSEKSKPSKPAPPPWNCGPALPYWSYFALFWSSPRTAAASFISLNFSVASVALLRSGWYFFARFL